MSGEDHYPETNSHNAGSRLHGTTTTLGLIAANEHQVDGRENPIPATSTLDSIGRGRRKSVFSIPEAGLNALAAFSPATKASSASFSVQAPRETIDRLQKHNKLLKQELSIEARAARELVGQEKRSQVEQIQSTLASFTRKLATTQRQVERTEQLMQQKTQELTTLRLALQPTPARKMLGESDAGMPSKAYAAAAAASGRLRMAENRLELALVRKNEVESANKLLLARVDAARRDRIIFDGIYKKLERETSGLKARHEQAKKDLAHVTQARNALAREVNRLQDAAESEQTEYDTQFQELKRTIELWRKEMGVRMADSERQSPQLNCSGRLDADVTQDKATAGPNSRVSALSAWKHGVDLTLTTSPESLSTTFEQAFATIREQTGLQNTETLAQELLARDAANFQQFKRVEELSREEVALQTQVAALTSQIETYQAHEGIASRASQKQQRGRIEALLGSTLQACEDLDAELEEREAVLTKIKASVLSVYNTMAHATASVPATGNEAALGHGVTDTTVFNYLQAIEMYTTALLQNNAQGGDHGQLQAQPLTANASPLPVGHGPPTLPSDPSQKLHVHVPSFGGVDGFLELPAQILSLTHDTGKILTTPLTKRNHSSTTKQQQQSRRLSTRNSVPLRQFVEALPLNEKVATVNPKQVEKKSTRRANKSDCAAKEEVRGDEEEERVLTYDELKRFAELNTKSQRRGTVNLQR